MKQTVASRKLNELNLAHLKTENRAFCLKCQKPIGLTGLSKVADFYKTEVEKIYLLIHRGKLHPIQNNRGQVMICNNSLFTVFAQRETQLLNLNDLKSQTC